MKTLTVVTPTYNRAKLLGKTYESLIGQTCDDFVWMIVDDGSEDGTEEVVRSFIDEGRIEIEYYKKENGGKHTALNLAIEKASTDLLALCLDSDDVFTEDAVEKIVTAYEKTGKKYSGYIFPKGTSKDEMLPVIFDDTLTVSSWQDAVTARRFRGEALVVLKSDYARQFRFPVFEGEKFCTEAIVWLKMTSPFYWVHDVVCICEYLDDGYSKNILKVFASSPRSYMLYNDLRISVCKELKSRYKFAVYYDGFAMMAKEKKFVSKCSSKALAAAALPFGAMFFIILKIKK